MVERGAPSTRHTTANGSLWSMATWAASPAGSAAPFFRRPPAGSRSPWSAGRSCVRSRSTTSIFLPADQRGCDRWSLPCSLWLFTVMRAIFTPAYPVSNPTGSDGGLLKQDAATLCITLRELYYDIEDKPDSKVAPTVAVAFVMAALSLSNLIDQTTRKQPPRSRR